MGKYDSNADTSYGGEVTTRGAVGLEKDTRSDREEAGIGGGGSRRRRNRRGRGRRGRARERGRGSRKGKGTRESDELEKEEG